MSELKTLKDFGECNDFKNTDIYTDLRQEAINHVEELNVRIKEIMGEITQAFENKDYNEAERGMLVIINFTAKISWIKHFFNVKEGDLK